MSILRRIFPKRRGPLRATQELILDLNSPVTGMKRVYMLTEELKSDPKQVELIRSLTLNEAKPQMGLKGEHGLFATEDWWDSINTGKMPLKFVSGIVVEVYEAGQDGEGSNNTVNVRLGNGAIEAVGIYTNDPQDIQLFQPRHAVSVVYALDLLKRQPASDGSVNYCEIALEMLVSTEPVGSPSEA